MGVEDFCMKHEIFAALAEVERQHAVRVLLAVESGSRAWGFASQDSDYDVRFIYVHPRDWYLRMFEQRDVIEPEGEGLLDPSGWELRKALRLFSKCNLALNEWLNSPIVYRETEGLRCQLQSLIPAFFNPIAAIHHYLSMARTALDARAAGGTISTKKLFYALRALFACRWIELTNSQPPTEFERLVEFVAHETEKSWITDLLQQKAEGCEGDLTLLTQQRLDAYTREFMSLDTYATRTPRPTKASHEPLDAILRQWAM
jgi:predicted nucleotidyltransferase